MGPKAIRRASRVALCWWRGWRPSRRAQLRLLPVTEGRSPKERRWRREYGMSRGGKGNLPKHDLREAGQITGEVAVDDPATDEEAHRSVRESARATERTSPTHDSPRSNSNR
ncbi:hypothetical protein HPB50_019495 [Hyalomma asiaticum]|uniref:Uncharacterized protein n=1 Tax=Hyalomma asiaticum TaxID=266040 RepID=A0ACB7T3L8_HYAAI|nr:hypothetical protein HPB50_019495 [Hyalomma asiaticum]